MRFTGLLVSFFALSLMLMPALAAQDKDKADKKDPDKTEPEKTDKTNKAAKKKPEEKLEHGSVIKSKIISMKPDSAHDFTIEVPMPDPQKIAGVQYWQMQQMAQISQIRDPRQYAQHVMQFQMQLAQKQATETFTMKPLDVRATESCKVRTIRPPDKFDETGNPVKWTRKKLDELKGNSKLPGYPSDFDMLKIGQFVEVYLAKQHGSPKDNKWQGNNQKKKKDDDAAEPMPEMRPDVVMIVIWAEPMR
jgi:hypothetical protein